MLLSSTPSRRFNAVAKLTHAKYDTSRLPATIELRKNDIVVAAIASHRVTISTNAQPGWCRPKKIHDQKTFKMSCTAHNVSDIAAMPACSSAIRPRDSRR